MKSKKDTSNNKILSFLIQWFPVSSFLLLFSLLEIYFFKKNVANYKIYNFQLLFEILIPTMITFLGFSITIITIFIGLEKTHILLNAIKNEKLRSQFNKYILTPIILSVIIILLSFIIIVTTDNQNILNIHVLLFLINLILYFILSMLRLFSLLYISFFSKINDIEDSKEEVMTSEDANLTFEK